MASAWSIEAQPASAQTVCADTALAALKACRAEARDDFLTAFGICINLSNAGERGACIAEARDERRAGFADCRDQYGARLELCDALEEDRYDPDFDPGDFDSDFTALTNPNPYFPLGIGNTWTWVGGTETITDEVLAKTKLVEGVTCIVVNDRVDDDGELIEDTDDWYAQASSGDVYYCGELAQVFETFAGDDPAEPELVDLEGSWKEGRNGARTGILVEALPQVGDVYRQEWALGDAEDAAEVLSTTYSYGDDPELDELVPQALADLLCSHDCLVTREFTPLEPDVEEFKYYAPGIGVFLEVNLEEGEVVQLVDCNFDSRCASLPTP